MKQLPFYLVPGSDLSETKYYLRSENEGASIEISKWQYDQLTELTAEPVPGTLSEANILRLHQEQDPASPLYKGPESPDRGEPESGSFLAEDVTQGFYDEPSRSKLEAEVGPDTGAQGTSVHTTDEVTKAAAGVTADEIKQQEVDKVQAAEENSEAPVTPAIPTDESNA